MFLKSKDKSVLGLYDRRLCFLSLLIGLGISDKKIIPRKTELTEQMVISDGNPAVPRNRHSRNSVPNPSAEEKTMRNSVPWIKNRSMLAEFRSEPFRGRENRSGFRSVEQK
jgi:hypothetical protein